MAAQPMSSFGVLFTRLAWMVFGPLALFLLISTIARSSEGWFTGPDFAYLGVLGVMLLSRIVEFRNGSAITADGQPMTKLHLLRYLVVTGVLGVAAWVVANILANHVWAS